MHILFLRNLNTYFWVKSLFFVLKSQILRIQFVSSKFQKVFNQLEWHFTQLLTIICRCAYSFFMKIEHLFLGEISVFCQKITNYENSTLTFSDITQHGSIFKILVLNEWWWHTASVTLNFEGQGHLRLKITCVKYKLTFSDIVYISNTNGLIKKKLF